MSTGLKCDNCGRFEQADTAIDWINTSYTGILGRKLGDSCYAGDFCSPKCVAERFKEIAVTREKEAGN